MCASTVNNPTWLEAFVALALPPCQGIVLVMQPEEPSREPPFEGPTRCGSPTPAVRVASAFAIARIMDPFEHNACHPSSIRLERVRNCRQKRALEPSGHACEFRRSA